MSRRKLIMKRRRRFFSFILVTTLVVALGGGLYNKSHHIENCEVLNVIKNTVKDISPIK